MDGKCRGVPGNRPLKKLFEAYGAGTHTWTAPSGLKQVLIALSGGGGGGGGGRNNAAAYGGNGGSGSYLETVVRLSSGRTYNISLGAGGSGGGNDAVGVDGSASQVTDALSGTCTMYVSGGIRGLNGSASPGDYTDSRHMGGRGGKGGYWNGGSVYGPDDGEPAALGGGAGGDNTASPSGGVTPGGGGGGGMAAGGVGGYDAGVPTAATAGGYGAGGGGGAGTTGGFSAASPGAAGGDGAIIIYELPTA